MKLILKHIAEAETPEPINLNLGDDPAPTSIPTGQTMELFNAAAATETTTASVPADDLVFDRLVFTDATSHKFWEAATDQNKLVVRFGRIGTKGQTQIKSFATATEADKEKEKMIREKMLKGYAKRG